MNGTLIPKDMPKKGNDRSFNLRTVQKYFQPAPEKQHSYKKERVYIKKKMDCERLFV